MIGDVMKNLAQLALSDGESFTKLVEMAGLNPASAFRGADLSGVDFGTCDLAGYDFSDADLSNARLDRASILGAIFDGVTDTDTRWPPWYRMANSTLSPTRVTGQEISPHISTLRRYARALTGSQEKGDLFVRATIEAIVSNPAEFPGELGPRVGLYAVFQKELLSTIEGQKKNILEVFLETPTLQRVDSLSRQALLLTRLEGFNHEEAGYLLNVNPTLVQRLVEEQIADIERESHRDVLIIEDNPTTAIELETIVRSLGHRVVGIAETHEEAVAFALELRPNVVLADFRLADGSSGIDAVRDILKHFPVTVIYITGYPEEMAIPLVPENCYLITKPFNVDSLKFVITQAIFFDEPILD